jgi:hypothetical protein
MGFHDGHEGTSSAPPAGFDAAAYRAGHTAGWERRRREITAEPYNFLFHVLRDENATTSDRIAAAIALMQHHRLADLDLTDGVGGCAAGSVIGAGREQVESITAYWCK